MTAREFAEWQAYYRVEPFGEARHDLQAGVVAAQMVNLFKKRGEEPARPSDYLLQFGAVDEAAAGDSQQTWQDQLRIVEMMNAALGGKDKRKRG